MMNPSITSLRSCVLFMDGNHIFPHSPIFCITCEHVITARKQSLGQGNIFTPVRHSVHTGVCLSACWDTTHTPQTRHPLRTRHPPPGADPPGPGTLRILLVAGSLESANSSILDAHNLFKDFGGEKNQDCMRPLV